MTDERELAQKANAWPFAEARKLAKRLEKSGCADGPVLFETGYGPSGLPHIGTFAEVARTTMVRHAFGVLTGRESRLIAFSDDMDGLRKVPDNVPEREMLGEHLDKPLTAVPDPFGCHDSFGQHNNAQLRSFLDQFGFDYEFVSSTDCYGSGRFDEALLSVLEHYEAVINVILPTLGPERRATYSPFLPLCPETGRVLQVPILERDEKRGCIVDENENGKKMEAPVTGGNCKLQWKADWAMRWVALSVDYEMSGKDLIESVQLSSKICRILGGWPPEGFTYELFLDENGEKISKSRGNGLGIEEWLRYAPPPSLGQFMFQKPSQARRLYFDVIPRNVDEYMGNLSKFQTQNEVQRLSNPAWHIHAGSPPPDEAGVGFALLLNLAGVCQAEDKEVLWYFIPESAPILDQLTEYAVNYYKDFVKPNKSFRPAEGMELEALADLAKTLAELPADSDAETIQTQVYEVGKRHPFEDLRSFFRALYEILLGQSQGPRMGSFIALYGLEETGKLIARALAGEDLAQEK